LFFKHLDIGPLLLTFQRLFPQAFLGFLEPLLQLRFVKNLHREILHTLLQVLKQLSVL